MENEKNGLNIGAARLKINIPDNFFPYRSFRGRLYIGVHDDLHVRCIMLGNPETSALILSLELGDFGDIDRWLEKISRATGVPASNILITVTHTHEAPHVSDSCNQAVVDVEKTALFGECVWQAVLEAIKTAKMNMRPGRIGYGTGQCNINLNRDFNYKGNYIQGPNPHGISDKTVAVMKFEDLNGEVIAYLFNYAVHGSIMFWLRPEDGGMLVGGDLPGETSRYIEKRHDDRVVALWTCGAAGDQHPHYLANRMTFDSQGNIKQINVREAGYLLVQVQAESLADEVLLVAADMPGTFSKAVIQGIHKKVMVPGQKKLEDERKTVYLFGAPEPVCAEEAAIDDFKFEDADPVEMHLSLLLINHIALVGIPGEPVCSIGMLLKNTLPYRNVVVVTQCNGSVSYISDEAGYEKRTFAATASHIKRGCAEKAIVGGTEDMIEELEGDL